MKRDQLVFIILILIFFTIPLIGYFDYAEKNRVRENVKTLVLDAVSLIENEGKDAFPAFRLEGSKWFHGETYVFVWQTDGIRLVYPPDLSGEGQNVSGILDVTGKAIGRLFIDVALSKEGEGWVDYQWPKPGEKEPSIKQTYIKATIVDEQSLLVGSGFYLDTSESSIIILQYSAIILESLIASTGLFIAIRKKRFFGYGIFLTFIIYVFYDLVKLIPLDISNIVLYPMFFIATLSIFWAIILIYKENKHK
ncbi:MAG: cache domain-containing protein [Candidatus Bathyarchaeota archaeon]